MGGSTGNKRRPENRKVKKKATKKADGQAKSKPRNFHVDVDTFKAMDQIAAFHFTDRTAASRYSIHATADNLANLKPKPADIPVAPEGTKMERKQLYLPDGDMKLLDKIARALRSAGAQDDLNISAALRYAIRRTAKQCQQRT